MKYTYRNLVIVEYDPDRKEITFPREDGCVNITNVRLLVEDTKLLEKFFYNAYLHQMGDTTANLTDTVVN